jgi:hypothetical protein
MMWQTSFENVTTSIIGLGAESGSGLSSYYVWVLLQ